ncbi:hypothetical protein [Streptomyces sp. GESEQ-35]|uniref:hypothetical protein n=1 Tax=Streptomyces sp. GESEQ-35 TaxID=2812657 RepID=UPI001B33CC16
MAKADRIDVHTHVVPPFWGKALPSHGGDPSAKKAYAAFRISLARHSSAFSAFSRLISATSSDEVPGH